MLLTSPWEDVIVTPSISWWCSPNSVLKYEGSVQVTHFVTQMLWSMEEYGILKSHYNCHCIFCLWMYKLWHNAKENANYVLLFAFTFTQAYNVCPISNGKAKSICNFISHILRVRKIIFHLDDKKAVKI